MKIQVQECDRKVATTEILEESIVTKNRKLQETIQNLKDANASWDKINEQQQEKIEAQKEEISQLKKEARIANSQIYSANEAHFKEIKELKK